MRKYLLTRKLVDKWNITIPKHDYPRRQNVESLVRNEGHPWLNHEIRLVQRNQGHEVGRVDQIGRCGCEYPCPR